MIDILEEGVKKRRVPYIRITGSTPLQDRINYVDSFQRDDFMKIAILSITACGTGITLTAASCIVFAELHWTPSVML